MLNGFWNGSKFDDSRTKKQKLEQRIRNSVLNMIIDRNQSFLRTARKQDTFIIVNNRDGFIQEYKVGERKYISIPTSFEDKFDELNDFEAELLCDEYIKAITTTTTKKKYEGNTFQDINNIVSSTYSKWSGESISENILSEQLYEERLDKEPNEEEKEQHESNEGQCTTKGMSSDGDEFNSGEAQCQMLVTGKKNDREYSFEDTELNPDSKLPSEVASNSFYNKKDYCWNPKREPKLKALANQIVKSFNGRISKLKTTIPNKRLVSKALILDNIEKIYQNKKGNNGKHLNVNLIIDMSGSMSGEPITNALEMIYIFNEIALSGKVNGSVIWSEDESRCKVSFPMPRALIRGMSNTGGAEGLGRNLEIYKKELKSSDVNICMTDGQLCTDPIMKDLYEKENIDIIGVYVNPIATDLTKYTNSLDRWFSHSVVRRTTEELCEKLIAYGLRKKHK